MAWRPSSRYSEPMPPTIEDVRAKLDVLLDTFCKEKCATSAALAPAYGRLWQTMHQTLAAGGKRLRPYMILLTYKAYGGKEDVLTVAAAWEMLHCCLLVHDDIIDRDYTRHGKPNVAGQYLNIYGNTPDSKHYANCAALIAGDLALTSAYEAVIQSHISPEQKTIALSSLNNTMFVVAGGELIDTESVMLPITKVDTETIAYLKTARYSFIDPLILGAKLAGANEQELIKIDQLGKAVGVGYQLADDLLGIFGNEQQTGKSITSDLREGKRTALLQELMTRATPAQRKKIESIVGRADLTDADAAFVRTLATKSGAKQAVEAQIQQCSKDATAIVHTLQIDEPFRKALLQLINLALQRNH